MSIKVQSMDFKLRKADRTVLKNIVRSHKSRNHQANALALLLMHEGVSDPRIAKELKLDVRHIKQVRSVYQMQSITQMF